MTNYKRIEKILDLLIQARTLYDHEAMEKISNIEGVNNLGLALDDALSYGMDVKNAMEAKKE